MIPRTKPRGDQASFVTSCYRCNGELTITNGRPDRHDCTPPISLADLSAALDNR